jgi:hypothetical protein
LAFKEWNDGYDHEQRIRPHDLASWPLLFCLVYGPVRLRVAGDIADALNL